MKKIIIVLLFLTGLKAEFKQGKIFFNASQVCAQISGAVAGQVWNQGTDGNYYLAGYATGSDIANNPGAYFVQHGGSYDTFIPNGGYVGTYNLQNTLQGTKNGGSGGFGDEDYEDIDWGDQDPFGDGGSGGGSSGGGGGYVRDPRLEDCAGVYRGYAYWDKCGRCVGGNTGLLECDCNGDPGGTAHINSCGVCVGGNTGQQDRCDSSVIKYYITVDRLPKRYFDGDKIMIAKSNTKAQLIIHLQNGVFDATNSRWTENDSLLTLGREDYLIDVSAKKVSTIRVDSAGVKTYTTNPLIVYNKPIVYFKVGDHFNGEYGFDDSSHKHYNLRAAYPQGIEVKQIDTDTAYYVPWMSLLDGQSANIKVDIKDNKALDSALAHDPNFSIKFVTNYPTIQLNGLSIISPMTVDQLKNMGSINITAAQLDTRNDDSLKTIKSIFAITNTGDTVGKLNLSCNKPKVKKVLLVSVNIGSGYRPFDKLRFIDSINRFGHNQLARRWELYTPSTSDTLFFGASVLNGLDTLNLSNEFTSTPNVFMKADTLMKYFYIDSFFSRHKGFDIVQGLNRDAFISSNDTGKIHVIFIMNYSIKASDFNTVGVAKGLYKSVFWIDANYKDEIHEMGHLLYLSHSFDNLPRGLNIPIGTTSNYMDYPNGRYPDPSDRFYYSQWIIVY